jgi:glycosyltransferase involved in cell wall biosynthesis
MPRGRRILIDGTMARGGGGFTYLVNVLPQLIAQAPEHRFCLLLRNERLASSIAPAPNLEIDLRPEANWLQRLFFSYGQLPGIVRKWGADLYFSAGETAPLRAPCPMIASLRNPIIYTDLDCGLSYKQIWRMRVLRGVSRMSARSCDRILFVSADSARWIGDSVGVPAHKRTVVHHGIDAAAWSRDAFAPGPRTNDILYVSSIYWHKNAIRLVEAWAMLARKREMGDLLLIGDVQQQDCGRELERVRARTGDRASRIHVLGEVPYAEIRSYYARAGLFAFPSYLESFGHPLLEAMAMGLPTVAADIPVFRELAGDAAIYADPFKVEALAAAIEEALFTPTREALIERSRERVRSFGWSDTARRLLALFDEVWAEREARA